MMNSESHQDPLNNSFSDSVIKRLSIILVILSLLCKSTSLPNLEKDKTKLGIVIVSAELAILLEKICFVWSATRDVVLRKFYLSNFYRYGLDFQINCNNTTSLICILLCGDVATNPGPLKQLKCVTLNSRSLKSLHETATGRSISNIHCFHDLVYGDDIDVICVNKTWLNGNISSLELLNDNFTIYCKDCTA